MGFMDLWTTGCLSKMTEQAYRGYEKPSPAEQTQIKLWLTMRRGAGRRTLMTKPGKPPSRILAYKVSLLNLGFKIAAFEPRKTRPNHCSKVRWVISYMNLFWVGPPQKLNILPRGLRKYGGGEKLNVNPGGDFWGQN